MKPIGLAFKDVTINVFTGRSSGELMVVHQCMGCNAMSRNRIAGDDNTYVLIELLHDDVSCIRGIDLLTNGDKDDVVRALFGEAFSSCGR